MSRLPKLGTMGSKREKVRVTRTFRARLTRSLGREEKPIFSFNQGAMKAKNSKVLEGVEVQVITSEGHPDPRDIGTDLLICGGQFPNERLHHALLMEEETFPVCSAEFAKRHASALQSGDIEKSVVSPCCT